MNKFCESLKQHSIKVISFKTKKVKLSTKEQRESDENAKICSTCKSTFENEYLKDKKYCKIRDHYLYTRE